ncbi:MAG: HgcAB-like fusion protein [Candidatus Bathyarchaeia archaeon]
MMKWKGTLRQSAETLFRWVPFSVEPGLRVFGNPDENSPVFLTCNYDLTVKRVSKYLRGLDCYLLVARSKGINVWCASCGGDFNEFSVISAIKTSGITDKVRHRTLIAPQLSAPGIDIEKVKEETGWNVRFGPVYAKDIPRYINKNFRKTERMRLVEFNLKDRLEMATIYFVTIALALSIPSLIFFANLYPSIIVLTGLMIYSIYISFPYIPVNSGFVKVILGELVFLLCIIALSTLLTGEPFGLQHLVVASVLVAAMIGIDFNGTSPTYKSDLGELFYRRGYRRMPFLTGVYRLSPYGSIQIDQERCSGCTLCYEVCPRGVYKIDFIGHKAKIVRAEDCVNCNACVRQCPQRCLTLA